MIGAGEPATAVLAASALWHASLPGADPANAAGTLATWAVAAVDRQLASWATHPYAPMAGGAGELPWAWY
jgi:hypothetical protein